MMTDAIVCANRFCGQDGWESRAKMKGVTHLPDPHRALNYKHSFNFAQTVIRAVYQNVLVRDYDRFVAGRNGGHKVSYLRRLAEDDATSGVNNKVDKAIYGDWQPELTEFVSVSILTWL